MPTDHASVLELVQAIGNLAQDLTKEGASLSNDVRQELVRNAERLAIAAREPEENLYFQATQTAQNSAIRAALGMGVCEAVPFSGSGISATDLSAKLHIDSVLLVRIMRACTSTHLFREVSPSHYAQNAFSALFLVPANRDMFKQMYDFLGPGVFAMPHFLDSIQYQNPTDYNKSAFHYGHRTSLGFWEYLKEDPERAKMFNSGMQSLATVGAEARSAGLYPFDEELGREGVKDTDVVIVDVGGGRGQALKAIKAASPRLKGRMVLQDMPDVIDDAKASGLPSFIEPMAASFFERQPIKVLWNGKRSNFADSGPWSAEPSGASVYHFRRIFHDWSDDVSVAILRNTVPAMSARSRILITDNVVPEIGAPRQAALQDINMMCFGGMERTQLQWNGLLGRAGLSIKRFWAGDGNPHNVIEATLPT